MYLCTSDLSHAACRRVLDTFFIEVVTTLFSSSSNPEPILFSLTYRRKRVFLFFDQQLANANSFVTRLARFSGIAQSPRQFNDLTVK